MQKTLWLPVIRGTAGTSLTPPCFAGRSCRWKRSRIRWQKFKTRIAGVLSSGSHIMLKLRFVTCLPMEWKCRLLSSPTTQPYKNCLNDSTFSFESCTVGERFFIGSPKREWMNSSLHRSELNQFCINICYKTKAKTIPLGWELFSIECRKLFVLVLFFVLLFLRFYLWLVSKTRAIFIIKD